MGVGYLWTEVVSLTRPENRDALCVNILLRSSAFFKVHSLVSTTTMADSVGGPDEAARLWRVNRTVHELVKDRVSLCFNRYLFVVTEGISRDSKFLTMKSTWILQHSNNSTRTAVGALSTTHGFGIRR